MFRRMPLVCAATRTEPVCQFRGQLHTAILGMLDKPAAGFAGAGLVADDPAEPASVGFGEAEAAAHPGAGLLCLRHAARLGWKWH